MYFFDPGLQMDEVESIQRPIFDANNIGNFTRFFNHLCEPNIFTLRIYAGHRDERFPDIGFFAKRGIQKGEEIGFDYRRSLESHNTSEFACEGT